MRHLLHVLREGEATYVPQPRLDSLRDLVAEVSRTGTPVALDVDAGVGELPAGIELCAYRVVQEALTNVCKHAPGADTSVMVRLENEELTVSVHNGPAGASPPADLEPGGHGLAGMAERVRLYGGRLRAERLGDGFVVDAVIPVVAS
jgi:signal transduction histidine kinase